MAEARIEIEQGVAGPFPPRSFEAVRGLPDAPPEPVAPGTEWRLAHFAGRPVARLTLAMREGLVGAPGRTGLIGHYEALDPGAGVALLRAAGGELEARGAERVLGPMNGSTWSRYRLALPSTAGDVEHHPPYFASEPRNPFDYPDHFVSAGFSIAARYESRIDDLAQEAGDVQRVAERVARSGITLRSLDLDRFDDELVMLHALSLEAFAGNPYYSPIDLDEFRAIYQPLRFVMDPEFVTVALDAERRPVGFFFAFADPVARLAGAPARLIAKTIAVAPRARGYGLANSMMDQVRTAGRARGFHHMIYALMHVDNPSMRFSHRHGGNLFRRYALWERTVGTGPAR